MFTIVRFMLDILRTICNNIIVEGNKNERKTIMNAEEKLLNGTIEQVKALYLKQAELKAQINKLEETLKDYLVANGQTLVVTEAGSVSYKEIVSKTLNVAQLRKSDFAFIYDKFSQEKTSMRFKVA